MGLLAASALGACAPRTATPRAPGEAMLHVAAGARAGNGSAGRPFGRIADALAAASDGAVISLAAGHYSERVRIDLPVEIEGPREAIVAPEGGAAFEVRAPARLGGFTIGGGDVGIEALAGSEVRVRGLWLEGRLRFGVRARGATLDIAGLRADGPAVAVACLDGCAATVRRAWLAGSGAGLLVGDQARLEASDCALDGYEQCAAANPGGTLVLAASTTRDCSLNAVAATKARLELRDHLHHGPARSAVVQLVGADAVIDGGWFSDPGSTGIAVRLGTTLVRGLTITGARLDSDGLFGDAVFALEPTRLEIVDASFERNLGAGVEVMDGQASLRGVLSTANGAGVIASRGARVALEGGEIDGGGKPGLVAIEGSRITARGVSLRQAPARQDAASGAVVHVRGPGPEPAGEPRRRH